MLLPSLHRIQEAHIIFTEGFSNLPPHPHGEQPQRTNRGCDTLVLLPLFNVSHEAYIIFYGGVFKPAAAAPPRTKSTNGTELALDVAAPRRRVLMAGAFLIFDRICARKFRRKSHGGKKRGGAVGGEMEFKFAWRCNVQNP